MNTANTAMNDVQDDLTGCYARGMTTDGEPAEGFIVKQGNLHFVLSTEISILAEDATIYPQNEDAPIEYVKLFGLPKSEQLLPVLGSYWIEMTEAFAIPETQIDYGDWKIGAIKNDAGTHVKELRMVWSDGRGFCNPLVKPISVKKGLYAFAKAEIDRVEGVLSRMPQIPTIGAVVVAPQPIESLSLLERLDALIAGAREESIALDLIDVDSETQQRLKMKPAAIVRYADRMQSGKRLPNLKVVHCGGKYLLWDGFHTREGLISLGVSSAHCDVIDGSLEDAQDLSLRANAEHGVDLTDEDLFSKVSRTVKNPRHADRSNAEIARLCDVSPTYVGKVLETLAKADESFKVPETKTVTRGGKTYQMKTKNIGKRSDATLEELQAMYAPYGELVQVVGKSYKFELRQRGMLMTAFVDADRALVRFEQGLEASGIYRLDALDRGDHSCLWCWKRTIAEDGQSWVCEAKGETHPIEVDWAADNNGNCDLFDLLEVPAVPDDATPIPVPATPKPKRGSNAQHSSDTEEHYTPADIVDSARLVMRGIDLDVASCETANTIVKADKFLTEADNALTCDLIAGSAFCNPPGGVLVGKSKQALFWDHVHLHYKSGNLQQAVFLAFSLEVLCKRPEMWDYPICITGKGSESDSVSNMGRIRFLNEKLEVGGQPTHGNAIVYLPLRLDGQWVRECVEEFIEEFEKYGRTGILRALTF